MFKPFLKSRSLVLKTSLLNLIQVSAVLPTAWIMKEIFDSLLPSKDWQTIWLFTATMAALFIVNGIAQILNRKVVLRTVVNHISEIRHTCMARVLQSDKQTMQKEDTHTLYQSLTDYLQQLELAQMAFLAAIIPGIINGSIILCLMFLISVPLSIVSLIFSAVFVCLNFIVRNQFISKYSLYQTAFDRLSNFSRETLRHLDWIWHANSEQATLDTFEELNKTTAHHSFNRSFFETFYAVVSLHTSNIIATIILVVGGILMATDQDTLGGLMGFIVLINILKNYVTIASKNIKVVVEGKQAYIAIQKLLNLPNKTPQTGTQKPASILPISLQNIQFNYDDTPLFSGLNLEIPQTGILLIRGNNGEGKTTLVNLIAGLYPPTSGQVLFNGIPANSLDHRTRLGRLSFCLQSPVIVQGSLWHNIIYYQPHPKKEAIETLCHHLNFMPIVEKIGWDTPLDDHGITLSGGEQQRLSLIRTLAKPAELYIFDEPSNHLDDQTVQAFIQRIQQLDQPVVIISHDPRFQDIATRRYSFHKHVLSQN